MKQTVQKINFKSKLIFNMTENKEREAQKKIMHDSCISNK